MKFDVTGAWVLVIPLLAACRDPGAEPMGGSSGMDSTSEQPMKMDLGDPEDLSTSTSTTETPSDTEDVELPKLDVVGVPDAPDSDVEGCQAVDFLFVIDNSGSMSDEQDNLTTSFPGFFSAIQNSLDHVSSYHVGVTTTDDYYQNAPGCQTLGSLVVRTGGSNTFNADCGPYANGLNFMTVADHLPSTFKCAAKVGTSGSGFERPMNAMERALDGSLAEPGQCNEGFLRQNALLVIVVITDEEDQSEGTAGQWFSTVLEAKDGIAQNIVVIGLTPTWSDNITKFANLFGDNAFMGDVEAPDYGPLFADAIGTIAVACENFIPAG